MSRKTLRNLLAAGAILLAGSVATAALIKSRTKPARDIPPATQPLIKVHTVSAQITPVQITGFGTVKAKRVVTVVPQVSGEILVKSPSFEPGSFLSAGEILIQIDDTDYVLALQTAKANVAQAQYNLALAQEEAEVAQREWLRLDDDQAGNREIRGSTPLVRHEPQVKLAEANLTAATAAVNQARVNLDRCTIVAPFDGRVLAADADAGQYLRSGNAIGTLAATDMAEVTVAVPDADLAWITLGDPVTVGARFAGANRSWRGTAVRLGGTVDPRSRLVPVIVEIPDPYHHTDEHPALLEGMFVEVTFSAMPPSGSVVIPRAALRPGDEVWVVGPDGRLDLRPVPVSHAGVDHAVIPTGLRPGERVCTSNLQYVTQDMQVRVETETPDGDR